MTAARWKDLVERWRGELSVAGKPDEWESKRLLEQAGIAVPRGILLRPGGAIGRDGDLSLLGSPDRLVVKACSGELLHKTDRGAVLLDVGEAQLPAAVARLQQSFPDAGILVEEMVRFRGAEIIIGALHDPTFGPAVMAGAGGILTELYRDASFRLAPCSPTEAHRLLQELTIYPTLTGYRGFSTDVDSLARTVSVVSELASELIREGCQLDVNPIVWSRERWTALDVKVILSSGT